jgi:putative DNA primase/helicase
MSAFCSSDVIRAVQLLHGYPDPVVELRVLSGKGVYSGYYNNFEMFATAAECWNGRGAIYLTLNKVHPDCAARRLNRVAWTKSGETTKDKEIIQRINVYIDCDPKRISGIASTDEEHAASLEVALAIREQLRDKGLPDTALISSGNGHGLFLGVDLPAEDGGLTKRFLEALDKKFSNKKVSVDTTVSNAARIARLPGTLNIKGESVPRRPHRLAKIIEAPTTLIAATAEQLQAVIDSINVEKAPLQPDATAEDVTDGFHVGKWLDGLGVAYKVVEKADGTQYSLAECPFKGAGHPPGGCAILQKKNGLIVASCMHAKCEGKNWFKIRQKLDPSFDARVDEAVLPGSEAVDDPHRLARLVLEEFAHPDHHTIVMLKGFYYIWKDGVWKEQKTDEVKRVITRRVKAEFDRYVDARAKHGSPCRTPQVTTWVVGNVLNALSSMVAVTAVNGPGWLTGEGWPVTEILVCKSSIIHLSSYLEGRQDYAMDLTPRLFVTNKLEFDFDPSAPTPKRWLQLMDEIWEDDPDSPKLLQEFFGYCLTPDVSLQKFLMLIGKSRGGKGVITRLLSSLIGKPNVCAIRLSKMTSRFGLEDAVGKSLILVPDANMPREEKTPEIVELVKAITGCDPVDVDRKGRPVITSVLPAKIVVASNNMIALSDESAAFYNRMLTLKFTKTFLGREDLDLDNKLNAELSGILLWAIEGFRRLRHQRYFTEPASGKMLKQRLKNVGSSVACFVEDRCVVDPLQEVDRTKLYNAYKNYCEELQVQPIDKPHFGIQLAEAVPSVEGSRPGGKLEKRPRYYSGIGLLEEHSEDELNDIEALPSPLEEEAVKQYVNEVLSLSNAV